MIKTNVINQAGEVVGEITLSEQVFNIPVNNQVMFDAVVLYNANQRQATAKTKTRREVSGGGRKPWKQKGTGRARQGSIRSPQWRGGGIALGPTGEQNYKLKMNKKVAKLALKSALSTKANEKDIIVLNDLLIAHPKTKDMIAVLKNIKSKEKALIILNLDSANEVNNIFLSASNLKHINVVDVANMNVYDILNSQSLIMTEEAVKLVEEVLG